jgi:hypothetical protein
VGVEGALRFRSDIDTRLRVGTLLVKPSGELTVGTAGSPIASSASAEIVIANQPLNTTIDPSQFGTGLIGLGKVTMHGSAKTPTFTRIASEPRTGQTTLTLAGPVSGWRVGDRLVLPDTRLSWLRTSGLPPSGRSSRNSRLRDSQARSSR